MWVVAASRAAVLDMRSLPSKLATRHVKITRSARPSRGHRSMATGITWVTRYALSTHSSVQLASGGLNRSCARLRSSLGAISRQGGPSWKTDEADAKERNLVNPLQLKFLSTPSCGDVCVWSAQCHDR